jgi:hypothetical protein
VRVVGSYQVVNGDFIEGGVRGRGRAADAGKGVLDRLERESE